MNSRVSAMKAQAWIGLAVFAVAVLVARELGVEIVAGQTRILEFAAIGFAACAVAIATLRNWRTGFYCFLVWLMFEDFVRKYMGNSPILFFGKDVLLAFVYLVFFAAIKRRREKVFRPPFLTFLSIFIWLGVLQIFNPNSPHILYGLLGFKVYFYYIPLMYAGYALIRNDEDLRKFLVGNAVLACIIASLGIAQAILGNGFLNPAQLAPELQDLGDLYKVTPLTNQIFPLPDSVFVSSGRYALYLILAVILVAGAAGYLALQGSRKRRLVFLAMGILGVAALLSGNRGAFVYSLASLLVLAVGFMWGAPRRRQEGLRLTKGIRRGFIAAALGLAALLLLFPDQAGSRIAYYTETLLPGSSANEVSNRAWDYPIQQLESAFNDPHWVMGNGIGTASLGMQYVAKLIGKPQPNLWVEEGYGVLIVEMGILAPFLWILWTAALLCYSWKVVRSLRGTLFFPVGFAILWYAFLLLYPFTYGGMSPYQNYVCNAYLWLLVGILFRLPELAPVAAIPAAVSPA
ncbi:MAG: hypothetical protein WA405_09230 [Candidatus Acidiferrales bacterium]